MRSHKSATICAIFIAATALNGCYSNHQITKKPALSQEVAPSAVKDQKVSAYISGINLKDGNVAQGFDGRLMARLNKSGLFENVINGTYQKRPEGSYVDLNLEIVQTVDNHSTANMFKGFFTGLTLYLLAPALPITYDFNTAFTLNTKWPNGIKKTYQAECASHAYGTLYQAQDAFKLAGSEATDECLNSIVNQLAADYQLMALK
jgi:hypothetical protein